MVKKGKIVNKEDYDDDYDDYDDDDYDDEDYASAKKGMSMSTGALIALVLAGVCLLSVPVICVAIAIPNLLEARKHGNEASAAGSMRTISASQAVYLERSKSQRYGNFQQLEKAGYFDSVLASGMKQGYEFEIGVPEGPNGQYQFWAKASPVAPGQTGDQYFFTNQSGVIRWSLKDFEVDREKCAPTTWVSPMGRK
jgi:hypothetical protein